ncbi:MAG: anti-sigma factor [Acidimicrobiales bacterium]
MTDDLHPVEADADIEAILRSLSDDALEFDVPPHSVWEGIQAAVEAEQAPTVAAIVQLASRRRLPIMIGAVAAALVVIAGVAAVLLSDDGTAPIEVASAELVYVPDDPAFVDLGIGRSANVTLLADGDAEKVRVEIADLPDAGDDSDLEIWLIGVTEGDPDIVPLGLVEDPNDPGTFTVPADFDRSAYDAVAVDISIEPHDGNESHSGMSLVRGVLST